jgi:hypothetical protein
MIDLPRSLNANGDIELYLPSSRTVTLVRATTEFARWKGPAPPELAGKEVVDSEGRPASPDAAVLRSFQVAGWGGAWLDEDGGFRSGHTADSPPPDVPPAARELLDRVQRSARTPKGAWDLCCWREDRVLFCLVKRVKGDRFGAAQLFWLEAAFLAGLSHEHFLVVEWEVQD